MTGPRPDKDVTAQLDAAVRRLTTEVVSLRGQLAEVQAQAEQAGQDANATGRAVTELADAVRSLATSTVDTSTTGETANAEAEEWPTSWWLVRDPEIGLAMLTELADWLEAVYVRYNTRVPDCWPWHQDAIAELWALRDAWYAVHEGPTASPTGRMDWHERWRPGVVARLVPLGNCTLEQHTRQPSRWRDPRIGGRAALTDIAGWWATTQGYQPTPTPTPDQVAQERGARTPHQY